MLLCLPPDSGGPLAISSSWKYVSDLASAEFHDTKVLFDPDLGTL